MDERGSLDIPTTDPNRTLNLATDFYPHFRLNLLLPYVQYPMVIFLNVCLNNLKVNLEVLFIFIVFLNHCLVSLLTIVLEQSWILNSIEPPNFSAIDIQPLNEKHCQTEAKV